MINFIKEKTKQTFFFIFIKSLKTSIHTVIQFKKNRPDINFFDLYNFFIIRFIFGLTYFRNKIGYRKTSEIVEYNNFEYPLKKNKILEDLVEKGFSDQIKLKDELKENLLNEILQNLKNSQIIFKDKSIKKKEITFKNKEDVEEYLIKSQVHIIKSSIDLGKSVLLNRIFKNNFFVTLAKDYLNDDKITIVPSFFISAPNNILAVDTSSVDKLLSLSAQEYHFDVDFKKFYKIFVYFSDVLNEANGCHVYIPKTHREKRIDNMITSRFKTSDIEKNYTPKFFLGEFGTTFITDPFGIHKGTPVSKGTRLTLIFEYGKGHFPFNNNCAYI
jgi:hypothetical protein